MTNPAEGPPGGGLSFRFEGPTEETPGVVSPTAAAAAQATFEQRYRAAVQETLKLRAVVAVVARRLDNAELTLLRREHLAGEVLSLAALCRTALEEQR